MAFNTSSSAPVASAPVATASVLASTPMAFNTSSSAPAASLSVIAAINQIAMLSNIDESNHDGSSTLAPATASHTNPMEDENVDLGGVEDVAQAENGEDAGFDVVENITLDLYQRQHQECEAKKSGAH
jgi:hypothetical protein